MSGAADPKALKAYYQACKIGKGFTRAETKELNDERARAAHRKLVDAILEAWGWRCVGYGVSPVCTKRACDPHELIGRGVGGIVSWDNTVPICRACHHEADGKVGGNRLVFGWLGMDDGKAPRAWEAGNTWVQWVGKAKSKLKWLKGAIRR